MAHYRKQIQPVNNYIGLNFLRERLANRTWDGNSECSTARYLSHDGLPTGGSGLGNNVAGSLYGFYNYFIISSLCLAWYKYGSKQQF